MTFYLWKMMKMYLQKIISIKTREKTKFCWSQFFGRSLTKTTGSRSIEVWIRGSGSVPNFMDPQHWASEEVETMAKWAVWSTNYHYHDLCENRWWKLGEDRGLEKFSLRICDTLISFRCQHNSPKVSSINQRLSLENHVPSMVSSMAKKYTVWM